MIDIASRHVVGFAAADHLRTDLVAAALANAVAASLNGRPRKTLGGRPPQRPSPDSYASLYQGGGDRPP